MNPYAPPTTISTPASSPWRHPFAMLMAGFAIGHAISVVRTIPALISLVSTGEVSMLTALGTLIGCALFYLATVYMPSKPRRAQRIFVCAALGMGLTMLGWSAEHSYMHGFMAGVPGSLLGFWLAGRLQNECVREQQ